MIIHLLIILLILNSFVVLYSINYKKVNNISYANDLTCDSFYLQHKIYYDTIIPKIFSDNDLRDKFFPNFKRVYPTIPKDDCILDIGSNIGDITELFHNYYKSNRIILAEPLELNCEVTKSKFSSIKNILIVNTAIGANRNTISWTYNKPGSMMYVKRNLITTNVTFVTLDSFYDKYAIKGNVFFLKIDVEGYEDEVLFTGRKLLSKGIIKYIYFEYHRVYKLICKTACSSLVIFLESFGYNCYLIGKYNMIKITHGCFIEIDSQKLAHVVAIKDNSEMENKFVKTYNKLYNK